MRDHQHSFMYFNPTNTPDQTNRAGYRALVESRGMMAASRVNPPSWFMVSTGPDLKHGTMAREIEVRNGTLPIYQIMLMPMTGMGNPARYDPTNGSVSNGDIVIFGP